MPVVAVTGASAGIGEALALELARRGYKVGLIARRAELLEALAARIRGSGGVAAWAAADVSDRGQVEGAIAALVAELGPVDLLVANAGVSSFARIDRDPVTDWVQVMRINLEGPLYAVGAVLPSMIERRSGHLAVVASIAGFRGLPRVSAYAASKAGIANFFEGLRVDARRFNIQVTTLNPGYIQTDMTAKNKFPMPFLISADRAARLMADALERKASVYTFPWQMGLIVGLARFLPNWLWDRIVGGSGVTRKLG